MTLKIPVRILVVGVCFLYLILPIFFVSEIRAILKLPVIGKEIFALGAIYSVITASILLFLPREVSLSSFFSSIPRVAVTVLLVISVFLSLLFFGIELARLDDYFYSDKLSSHLIYEGINERESLRLKYNVLLILFLPAVTHTRKWFLGSLFFVPPIVFEAFFSKHNYASHFLFYLFVFAWNSRVPKKLLFLIATLAMLLLLLARFTVFSSVQTTLYETIAAFLGEFTISWQSIPMAMSINRLSYDSNYVWYSDAISKAAGLKIGVAGNPVAEICFYFSSYDFVLVVVAASLFVALVYVLKALRVGSFALLVFIFYSRDAFRTGWSLAFSVLLKSFVVYFAFWFIIEVIRFSTVRVFGTRESVVRNDRN